MLENLVKRFRATGRHDEASPGEPLSPWKNRPQRPTAPHELWLILDDLLAGPCEDGSDRLQQLDRAKPRAARRPIAPGTGTIPGAASRIQGRKLAQRCGRIGRSRTSLRSAGASRSCRRSSLSGSCDAAHHRTISLIAKEERRSLGQALVALAAGRAAGPENSILLTA